MFTRIFTLFCAFNGLHLTYSAITTTGDLVGGVITQEMFVDSKNYVGCNHSVNAKARVQKWLKNQVEINMEKKNDFEMNNESNRLVILNAKRTEDEGNYTCVFEGGDNQTIKLIAKPVILAILPIGHTKDGKSVNIVEGTTLVLECLTNTSYPARFTWTIIHNTSKSDKGRLQAENKHNISSDTNGKSWLTISSAILEDRAYYECSVENDIGSSNLAILVRVKDKWMALWPFLGIVGEVIILCTIIFIYEKRRQKPDFDDSSDNATENKSPVASGTGKGQEIRQRK